MSEISRGDIYYADLNPVIGSEQGGIRPVLIVQNNRGNRCSQTVIVAAITKKRKIRMPTHVKLKNIRGLVAESVVLLEQIRTIDILRIGQYIGRISPKTQGDIDYALMISLGIRMI